MRNEGRERAPTGDESIGALRYCQIPVNHEAGRWVALLELPTVSGALRKVWQGNPNCANPTD